MSASRHGGFVNALVILGYIVTYLAGLVAGNFIMYKLLGIQDGADDTQSVIIMGISLFFTAPLCALGYHKILEKFDLELRSY